MKADEVQRHHAPEGVVLQREWLSPEWIVLAAFTVFLWGLLVVAVGHTLEVDRPELFVPLSLPIATAIGMAWWTAAGFLNHSHLEVSSAALVLRSGPIPLRRARTLHRDQIAAVQSAHYLAWDWTRRGTKRTWHSVDAVLRDGETIRLIPKLSTAADAESLTRELKAALE